MAEDAKAIENSQKRVEARNFDIRKNILKYDDVMNDQRKVIFEQRLEIMDTDDVSETIADMRHDLVETLVRRAIPERSYPEQWHMDELEASLKQFFNLEIATKPWTEEEGIDEAKAVTPAPAGRYEEQENKYGNWVKKRAGVLTIESRSYNWKADEQQGADFFTLYDLGGGFYIAAARKKN